MNTAQTATVGAFVAARGHVIELPAGGTLFFEGDRSSSVYSCVEGGIRLFVTLPSGRELVIGRMGPGEVFGELSAIDRRPRAASAVATEASLVAHLSAERFLSDIEQEPKVAAAVLRSLATQLRRANARLRARTGDTALVRAGHMLIELSLLQAGDDPSGPVELSISQNEIAEWIGVTREATARALARLRRDGLVTTGRRRVIVPSVEALTDHLERC